MTHWTEAEIPDLEGRTYVVTGAGSGIGTATARALAARRARVVLACRDLDKASVARAAIMRRCPDADLWLEELDVSSPRSVEAFSRGLLERLPHLDGLIHNAGLMMPSLDRTADGFETQFSTHVLGPFALTGRLLPLLESADAARVVTLGSLAHWLCRLDFDNLNAEKRYRRTTVYGQSKLAALILMHELQRRLTRSGASTISVGAHPGVARSELTRRSAFFYRVLPLVAQSTDDGALPSLMAATSPLVKAGDHVGPGGLLTTSGPPRVQPTSRRSRGMDAGERLWARAEKLTDVSYG